MIAIDTSVLVRYVTQDDPDQSRRANALFETGLSEQVPGYVTLVTLAEFHWVLSRKYAAPPTRIADAVRELLAAPTIVVEQAEVVESALAEGLGGFADCLVHYAALAAGCSKTVTFDRKFARIAGVERLEATDSLPQPPV